MNKRFSIKMIKLLSVLIVLSLTGFAINRSMQLRPETAVLPIAATITTLVLLLPSGMLLVARRRA